jgi:RNA polymerase sigma-70 factor (ECF subfamily)
MRDKPTDEELVDQIKAGRTDLFEELVYRYQDKLINYIFRMTNHRDIAMELTQDVFLKVFRSLKQYDPEFKFTTWVHRIASNATIDHLRKKRVQTYSLDVPMDEDGPTLEQQLSSNDLSPHDRLEMAQLKGRIMKAIDALPHIYRELIVLRHINHLSYDEIAQTVELPLGTVKNRIFRGREMLKVALADDMKGQRHGS